MMRFLTPVFVAIFLCFVLVAYYETAGQLPERSVPYQTQINDLVQAIDQKNTTIEHQDKRILELEELIKKLETQSKASLLPNPAPKIAEPAKPIVKISPKDPVPGHWTYPGEIGDHLRKAHGHNVEGMTLEEQLILHDQLHEYPPTTRAASTAVLANSPATAVQFQNCPNGVCPVQQQSPAPMQQQKLYQPLRTIFRRR